MTKNILITLLLVISSQLSSSAQEEATKPSPEDLVFNRQVLALHALADTFLYFPIAEVRDKANKRFIPLLVDLLKKPYSFYDPLDTLQSKINIVYPEDSSFRIFNWEVEVGDNIRRYYGAIQMRRERLQLYPLLDFSSELQKSNEDSILLEGKWYGGIIYRIHTVVLPDGNLAYMTFSLNRSDDMSSRKVLDALVFVGGKPIQWGLPFFNTPDGVKNRYIIEYNKMANVALNYDQKRDLIYFDLTRSEVNNDNIKYTRIPVGDYAGFRWNGRAWNYLPQIIEYVEYEEGKAPVDQPYQGMGLFRYRPD